jgi:HEAT repeat protein
MIRWREHLSRSVLAAAVFGPLATVSAAQDKAPADQAASLIENLQAKNVELRRNSATALRTADQAVQQKALSAMIDRLEKEKDGQVRLAVLDALAAMGHNAAPAVPALVQTLRTDFGGRGEEALHQDYRSALALAAIGKPAVHGLRGLLKENKVGVRAESAMALGRIGKDAEAAIPDLVVLLGDKDERIGREASLALGRIGTAAVDPLTSAAAHKDPSIRACAVAGLGYLPEPSEKVCETVLKSAHDEAPAVRSQAVIALARLKVSDENLLPILSENLRQEDVRVRLAVVNVVLGRRALLSRMARELEALLTAENGGVSRHAAFLLARTGPSAAPLLLGSLSDKRSHIDQIAEALAMVGRPIAAPLNLALKSSEPRVRRGAALALGQIRPVARDTVSSLTAGLTDTDNDVRAAFLTAISYLGPRAGESVPAVRALLRDESPAIRLQAVRVLAQSAPRDDRLVSDLTALLKTESDALVQKQAIDTVRSLGPPGFGALKVIIGKLGKGHPDDVRVAAVLMIESHGQAATAAVSALAELLDDPNPKLQTTAAQALASMGKAAQPAIERLSHLLKAQQAEIREAAVTAIGSLELDAQTVRPHLASALRDEKSEVRRAATRAIQRFGPQGAIFLPDIILLAEKKENLRSVERMLRRFEGVRPDARSLPELVKQLDHKQDSVRLLAIKFLALAGPSAREAIPTLERMHDDPSAEVRKQAAAASEKIKNDSSSGQQTTDARKKHTAE